MDGLHVGWDNRTAQQWLEEADRFDKLARRFDHHAHLGASFSALARNARTRANHRQLSSDPSLEDCDWGRIRRVDESNTDNLDYFRMRVMKEQAAAESASDMRVRRVHLELAERYQAFIRVAEAHGGACLRPVS
jgi:hypothetical protein